MKKITLINNNIYHIYNRGVEKRKIYLEEQDYFRFIHDLFEFNDKNPTLNNNRIIKQSPNVSTQNTKKSRKLLVDILAFCLMPNHYHILIKQKSNNGITEFMRKLGTGYTNYFNQKYERVGHLFQGKFKAALIKQESHFIHLPYYIHLNPLDLIEPQWKENGIKDSKNSMKFLESYRWSSFLDYIGEKNFPSVTSREFLKNYLGDYENYKQETKQWINDFNINNKNHLTDFIFD